MWPEVVEILMRNPPWVTYKGDGQTCLHPQRGGANEDSGKRRGQHCRKEKRLDTGENSKQRGRCERAQKATKNAMQGELIAEVHEMVIWAQTTQQTTPQGDGRIGKQSRRRGSRRRMLKEPGVDPGGEDPERRNHARQRPNEWMRLLICSH